MSTIHYHNIANEPVTAEVISISGQVIEINRSNQTQLHATGGGAYASSGNSAHGRHATASVSPISVTSTNSVHDDVYLLTEAGEELFLQLVNWENAGIRKGHHIQAIWLNVNMDNKSQFATPYIVINNRSLNKVLYDNHSLYSVVRTSGLSKSFVAMFTQAGMITKAFFLLSLLLTTTIILIPLVGVMIMIMSKSLNNKCPEWVEREVKPKLNQYLLPPVSGQQKGFVE